MEPDRVDESEGRVPVTGSSSDGVLVRSGLVLAGWSERWFPDPFVFALAGVVVVFVGGLLIGETPGRLAVEGGKSFWSLVPFTMQMVMIIVGGFVVASTPLVQRAIRALAGLPRTPRGAVAWVALLSMLTSLVSWGLSLVFSGLYVRELARRIPGLDYRAAGAAGYLGLGSVWAMGLSSSAAPRRARTRPGEWLDESPLLPLLVALLLAWYLVDLFRSSPQGVLAALDLPTYNLVFLTAGLLLHWRPRRFVEAVTKCIPATAGVVIQYPFYAVVFGMIVGTSLAEWLARVFVAVSTPGSYPLVVAVYSTVLGVFIPSAGSRWVIEAPYVLEAANVHQVHLGWVVQIYNASEALPNLINPFWMLPLLGILKLKARDLVGYGMLQLIVHVPLVYLLCWLFATFVPYAPPVK